MSHGTTANLPLIAVIGATGTGKSQLAIEIARKYNGEVINGDAMQLYDGLPVITNKVTEEERKGVPHHLLGKIGLDEQTWVVGKFVRNALGVVEEIRGRGKLPVLVGGTHYYTQNLLFRDQELGDPGGNQEGEEYVEAKEDKWPILGESTEVVHQELRRVDPVMADRWHPNDRRKIQRSLELFLQTGRKASDIYAEQRLRKQGAAGESAHGYVPFMRFRTLMLWVHTDTPVLHERLANRVDKMLDAGLLEEVHTLNAFADQQALAGQPMDETKGIWVSIGYKEFKPYQQALNDGGHSQEDLAKLHAEAVEKTKIATRQYSKSQIRWIRIKLVNALAQANASQSLYLLDASDAPAFDQVVVEPAVELTGKFLRCEKMPDAKTLSPQASELLVPKRNYDLSATPEKWARQHCELCNTTCVTEEQWTQHVKSRSHRRLVSKQREIQAAAERQDGID
ncbi:hypothetical protein MBLNU230_g0231t1 [Neophaeotheca triangularis]